MGNKPGRAPRERREHPIDFKEAAARRLLAGESSTALSRELDVRRSVLYRWRDAYRAEGRAGLGRRRGRPKPGHAPPPRPAPERDPRDERIAELERLLGRQAAELDFFERAFAAVNRPTPSPAAASAPRSTTSSSRSAPKARSASNAPASSDE